MKKIEELKKMREMNLEHLEKELVQSEKEFTGTKLRVTAGKMANYSQIDKIRKNIARLKTIINEKFAE